LVVLQNWNEYLRRKKLAESVDIEYERNLPLNINTGTVTDTATIQKPKWE